jgi:hypothetical protein
VIEPIRAISAFPLFEWDADPAAEASQDSDRINDGRGQQVESEHEGVVTV